MVRNDNRYKIEIKSIFTGEIQGLRPLRTSQPNSTLRVEKVLWQVLHIPKPVVMKQNWGQEEEYAARKKCPQVKGLPKKTFDKIILL